MAFVQLTFNQFVDPEWIIEFLIQNGNHAASVGEYEKLKQGNLHIPISNKPVSKILSVLVVNLKIRATQRNRYTSCCKSKKWNSNSK